MLNSPTAKSLQGSAFPIAGAITLGVSANFLTDAIKAALPWAFNWASAHLPGAVSIWLTIAAGLIGLTLGVVLKWAIALITKLPPETTSASGAVGRPVGIGARMTSPEEGDHFRAGSDIKVQGSYAHEPSSGERLVVATSRGGVVYPQGFPISTAPGYWQHLYHDHSVGETLIHVGVANTSYLDHMSRYFEIGRDGGGWHGYKSGVIADGLHIEHTITIHIDPPAG